MIVWTPDIAAARKFTWTEARFDLMRTMWLDRASASQIVEALGHGVTRNAVISKLRRSGMTEASREEALKPAPVVRPSPVPGSLWSEDEIAALYRLAPEGTMAIVEATGRSPKSVRQQANKSGLSLARVTGPEPLIEWAAMRPPAKPWTEEEVATLREAGPTIGPEAVAKLIGRTVSSVKSKASEVGIKFGAKLVSIYRRDKPAPVVVAPAVEVEVGVMLCIPLADIGFAQCRWPLGDPKESGFCFCGLPADGPYCNGHHRRAYQPGSRDKRHRSDTAPAREWAL